MALTSGPVILETFLDGLNKTGARDEVITSGESSTADVQQAADIQYISGYTGSAGDL